MSQQFNDATAMQWMPQVLPRVLIVSEDAHASQRLQRMVQDAGFIAHFVTTAAAALASLRRRSASIVIAERVMPDMSDVRLCRAIRNECFSSNVYVIELTAHAADSGMPDDLNAGADEYLSKPVSCSELAARLRTAQRILNLERSLQTVVEEKSKLAATDVLTGANSRRYFIRHLARELRASSRFGGKLSVLMLDIDHFRQLNDRYGHAIGDELLQDVARRIAAVLARGVDWYARVGGEEFAVVLPQTDLAGAAIVAEKLRARMAAKPLDTSAGPLHVTISLGGAGSELFASGGELTVDRLLEQAERCLHESKKNGRNCSTIADALQA